MCGIIAGLYREQVDRKVFERARDTLHHRGPDATGLWISDDRRWALGHTRLSIIGLDNGAQPMAGADGAVQMVVNGEFYGYRAIRERLRNEGADFATMSDSEIALHLYLRNGSGMMRELRGEFAVVIADRRNNVMVAARDRFGIKPLFYAVHNGNVLFASEIKALLALGVEARWDRESVFQEAYLFRPHERTLFAGIRTVPPGHYAVAQDGDVRIYPYWDLDFPSQSRLSKDTRSDEEIVAGFREVLDEAMRERLVADVEVASYLSGGIDSCSVLGLAQQGTSRPIRAYTITFDDEMFDESDLARRQAARDVIIEPVYNREKHPFMTPPARHDGDDAMQDLFADTFASTALDDQPVFDPQAVRALYAGVATAPDADRMALEGLFHRVLSTTLLHRRFGMTG